MNSHSVRSTLWKYFLLILLVVFADWGYPANTGKIAGKVVDKETGEPLIGANVTVGGTRLGAATDEKGRFTILQVPPGQYSVKTTYIGYHPLTIKEVEVRTDLTTRLTFELAPSAIESPTVEIVAEKKMVQHDVTASRRSISSEEVGSLPGIEGVTDVFRSQSGMIVQDTPTRIDVGEGIMIEPRDPSLKSVNIRGSRGGDALILIDGVPATHPMYGGFDIMDLNVEEIENIEIIKGAFSAEYGQTSSAIISITTKSGGTRYRGSLNYRTDALGIAGPSYEKHRVALNLNGPDPLSHQILPAIGIDLPGELTFFASTTMRLTNTPYNNGRSRRPLVGLPLGDFGIGNADWVLFDEKQDNKGNFNLRLDYQITDNFSADFSYRNTWKYWTEYQWLWIDHPDHTGRYSRVNSLWQIRLNHTLSSKTYYTFNVGYTNVRYSKANNGKAPPDFWVHTPDTMFSYIEAPYKDPLTGFYSGDSYQSPWVQNLNQQYSTRFSFTSQIHPEHLIKLGFYTNFKDLRNVNITAGGAGLSEYGRYVYKNGDPYPPPPGPYKEYGLQRWVIDGGPLTGGAYVTEKFEKESLILNAGIRMDWFVPGNPTNDPAWQQQWEEATGLKADWPIFQFQVDPRFGVSFPISPETNLYFSYGHFNKIPGLDNYIRDPYSGGFTGNPHLEFVKTVKYEFGFTHEFPRRWALDIKNYTKETSGEIGSTKLSGEYGLPIHLHDNKGYSRARGLEFELRKRARKYFSGNATYTLQWASGYSSSAFSDYRRSLNNLPNPIRERRLGWDVRHQAVIRATFKVPESDGLRVFGLKLPDNWEASLLTTMQSGRPYTPGAHDPVVRRKLHNTREMPPRYRTDIRIEKRYTIQGMQISIGIDMDNVFDQYNVTGRGFNNWTGEPYKYGDTVQDTDEYIDYYQMQRILQPDRFGVGRHSELIFELSW